MGFLRPAIVLGALLLAGCAVPYGKDNGYGGYADTSIEKNLSRVVFSSPGGLDAAAVHDLALLRAAEITRGRGEAFFAVVKENSGTTTRLTALPQSGLDTYYSRPMWVPGPGGPRFVIVSEPNWGDPLLYPAPIPFTELYIRGYASRQDAGGGAYDAAALIPRLRARYKITP